MPRDDELPELPPHLDPRRGSARPAAPGPTRTRTRAERNAERKKGKKYAVIGLRTLASAISVLLLIGAGLAHSTINRIQAKAGNLPSTTDVKGNQDVKGTNGADMNILVVGNDSRAGYTDAQLGELSTTAEDTLSTDTIMLIHVPANGASASVVSFPRDSYVDIPGYKKNKINSAYAAAYYDQPDGASEDVKRAAGQKELISTISALSGAKIDHYVEVSLLGFYNLTNAIGGVEVNLCQRAYDPGYTDLDLAAGKHKLMGKDALSFVRQRHHLDGGDLDRIKRQQFFFGAVIREVLGQDLLDILNISKLNKLVDALAGTIQYDQDLDPLELAAQMRNIAAGNVEFHTIPLAAEKFANIPGAGDVVKTASVSDIHKFFQQLSAPKSTSSSSPAAPKTVDPKTVTVEVYNGTTTGGLGTQAGEQLTAAGFTVDGVLSAASTDYPHSVVQYPAGMEAAANTVAAQIPGAITEVATDIDGKVRLIVGSDFGGGNAGESAPPAGTDQTTKPDTTAATDACVN
ncbi:LytR family transcriptional attenuator [Antricoccus suffuscus]|uniref:LytR family transcriptional attenuator n=1 Tax=Antricoccus suffuscus TaxID=1629062 RepID=A0A2T0ZQL6_9ACTN|nr:LCP family protein [Antricoccus suffuscus]PRZ38613.1 LytR family transcriptional attenuator [Antricoccus suffuscus]